MRTTAEVLTLVRKITSVIKRRFPHLTVVETTDIVTDIVAAIDEEEE